MSKTQSDFLLTLAYLLGERTVNSNTTAQRGDFIQDTLKEIYRAYPWPFATTRTTLTVASGVASLPSTFDYQGSTEAYFYQGTTQTPLDLINEYDQTSFSDGDHKYWFEAQTDGTYLMKTGDTAPTSIVLKYQTIVPTVNASIATPFDDSMTVALGARRYVKIAQDPNADVSQDEALFQKRLNENIAAVQVNNAKRKIRFIGNANGYRMGGGY